MTEGNSGRVLLDELYSRIAALLAQRSTCPDGRRHGAVVVVDGYVVSTGYNGPVSGEPPPRICGLDKAGRRADGCKDFSACPCVHAEENALATAARRGIRVEGGYVYVTKEPCPQCYRLLCNAGVRSVYVVDSKEALP